MSDLSDLSEKEMSSVEECWPEGSWQRIAIAEIRRHRSALAADRERVRSVVRDAVWFVLSGWHNAYGDKLNSDSNRSSDAIATRAAEQLATARAAPGILERGELDYLLEYLAQQRAESALEGRSGDSDAFLCWQAALSRLLGAP